jgi:hypothetical protein
MFIFQFFLIFFIAHTVALELITHPCSDKCAFVCNDLILCPYYTVCIHIDNSNLGVCAVDQSLRKVHTQSPTISPIKCIKLFLHCAIDSEFDNYAMNKCIENFFKCENLNNIPSSLRV